jgi:hypothetical protein
LILLSVLTVATCLVTPEKTEIRSAYLASRDDTERMVTYKREIRLWREANPVQRALMIRDDADAYWIACQMQHRRIMDPGPAIFSDPRAIMVQRRIDVDLFVVSLHRLSTVANLAAEVADPRDVLPDAITLFSEQTAGLPLSEHSADQSPTIANVRHVLEHGQNLEIRGGLGFASGQDGWFVSYRGRMWETQELLAAAETLHAAIRKAIDPEAFSDFRGDVPYIELRDPADIIQCSDPASGILARQASAMAEIQEGLRTAFHRARLRILV